MPSADLSQRNIVGIHAETVSNVTSTDFPGHYPGEDHTWNLANFKRNLRIKFYRNEPLHAEFDVVHIDASVANAFRRIMMAEVPTFAIEKVYMLENTSVIQDEVLSHRLGLVPIKANQDTLKRMKWYSKKPLPDGSIPSATTDDTIVFGIDVVCERKPNAPKPTATSTPHPDDLYVNHSVFAKDITYSPVGDQEESFDGNPPHAASPDILLAKLRPGQVISAQLHAVKGVGKDHAKFSPVAPASYRLLPTIEILEPIRSKAAERFKKCFPSGVVEVINDEAVVVNPRNDTVSREVLRHEEFKDKVRLGRVRDHFMYSVESSGQFDSDDIFLQSIAVLRSKCNVLKSHVETMLQLEEEKREREEGVVEDAEDVDKMDVDE
ncbi:RBP11-like subunits of RNA polymerase [Ascodesmis nigricans]|uniref:DNA-directed RNA polymerases I and III subunit RPAC1 n=1 Tax=Ascodesmis nigricans TaxID=341454 RepID=A0A4S2N5D7_9PEZI|nr:RBP11-like subunits of RNA polymerase [Ascodesmis nigricans]